MLFRFISTISLIIFLLLTISGTAMEEAVYRSLVVFTMLFVMAYIAYFMYGVIHRQADQHRPEAVGANEESSQTNEK